MIRSLLSRSSYQLIHNSNLNGNIKLYQYCNILKRLSHINNYFEEKKVVQDVMPSAEEQLKSTREIIGKVNEQISAKSHGRLFVVVSISAKQHLLTTEDLLVVVEEFAPTIGDKIRLEKVMTVGGSDFTLHGRPLLPKDLVYVEATVVEKTLGATQVRIRYGKKQLRFKRPYLSVLRINEIRLDYPVDGLPSVEGVEGRIF